ncbi:hypothetical protein ACNKHW_01270 [Shigella flexneri]
MQWRTEDAASSARYSCAWRSSAMPMPGLRIAKTSARQWQVPLVVENASTWPRGWGGAGAAGAFSAVPRTLFRQSAGHRATSRQ